MTATVFYQIAVMLLLVLVGWALSKGGKLPDTRTLGGYLANAALPATIINSMQVQVSTELLVSMGLTVIGFLVLMFSGAAVGFFVGRLAKQPTSVAATWGALAAFPNIIFMGWPFKYAAFGEPAIPLIPGVGLGFTIGCFTFGIWLLSRCGTNPSQVSLKKLLLQPIILSCFAGTIIMLSPANLPGPALATIEMLAATTTPVAMVIIGSLFAKCNMREVFLDGKAYLASFTLLVPAALAAHFLFGLFIGDEMISGFLTIGALMPAATILPVIAAEQGGDALFCSKVAVLSTVMSAATLPLLLPLLI
ncbi:MAG: AEC family transporter [Oscillospiraceae bacterium]|nr:AEC family transporter [Oscillospiraceae bacterium]